MIGLREYLSDLRTLHLDFEYVEFFSVISLEGKLVKRN